LADATQSTAIGKAIQAHLPEHLGKQILLPSLRQRTARTVATASALAKELELAQRLGYAEEEGENEEGAACVGAPIFDEDGAVVAGLSISAPASRLGAERKRQMVPVLISMARRISVTLAFRFLGGDAARIRQSVFANSQATS
jgi:DNA-binding IclR family transcriptional regulator